MISLLPRTRVESTSSPSTSSVTAGPPVRMTSISAVFNPRIPLEVREPRVHAGYDRDLGLRAPAQLRIVFLCELFVGLHGLIHKTHHYPPIRAFYGNDPAPRSDRLKPACTISQSRAERGIGAGWAA